MEPERGHVGGNVPSVHTLRRSPTDPPQILGPQTKWSAQRPTSPDKHRSFRSNPFVPRMGNGRHLTGEGKR